MPSRTHKAPSKPSSRDSLKKLRNEFEMARDLLSAKTNMLFKSLIWNTNTKVVNESTDVMVNTIYQYTR